MRHLDLCSGIGGFALAASWTKKIETVAFCEIDEFCRKVLKKNFSNTPIHGDVHTLKGDEYGPIDIITGGYPCQPFSFAGKRRGEEDDRHIWPEVFRITKRSKPRWLLLENVAGHIGMGLDKVLSDLESVKYSCRPVVIPACSVNAPHRRDRVWIIANSEGPANRKPNSRKAERQGKEFREGSCDDASNSYCERREGSGKRQIQGKSDFSSFKDCRSIEDWRRLPDILKPLLLGGNNGIPNRLDRTRGIGNAIVPQVAYEILISILKADEKFYTGSKAKEEQKEAL